MRISSLTIEKFRSIKKASISMSNMMAIVGENNAGKTAILRAINAVLNFKDEEISFINKAHQYAVRNNTYITIGFSELPENQIYEDKAYEGILLLQFSFSYSDNRKKYLVLKGRERISVDEEFVNEITNQIVYVYIPANRANKDVTWNDNSIFKELITCYAAQYTENRDTISGHVRHATNRIHDTILVKLENQMNSLYMQNRSVDFGIDFKNDIDYSFLLDKIELSLNEYGSKYLMQEWGSGTKSLAVIAMHWANALIKNRNVVLGIEEPETNLHPQAQKRFVHSIRNSLRMNETQLIFTTHSTVLVDELQHQDILLVRREVDETRGFFSSTTQLSKDFWDKYQIEEFRHYQYFGYKNSDFFFAKYVVVGESKNDCQVIEKMISDKLCGDTSDISFLDAGGVENLKYPYFLLKELNIPFTLVVDKDFFFTYKNNNNLENSRDANTGLPIYKYEAKTIVLLMIYLTRRISRLNW